jgi:drug/metabolite transporter (DMT)-like permease
VTARPATPAAVQRRQAMRRLTFCTLLWALSFPLMKALVLAQQPLLSGAGSWFLTSLSVLYRFGLAGLLLLLCTARRMNTITRREAEQGLVLAGFGGLGILFQMDGLSYTAASTSAFLTQGYCIFIPLWLALVNRRRPTGKQGVCILLVVAGVAVLAGVRPGALKLGRGELETLLASLLFTGQIIALEHERYAGGRPGLFSTVMFAAMAGLCGPVVWATAPSAAACLRVFATPATAGMLAVLVVFCTLGAYTVMNTWQPFVSATEAGLIYCLEPVLASLLALFLPFWLSRWAGMNYANEHLTMRLVLGGGLITAANGLLQSRWLEPRPERTQT